MNFPENFGFKYLCLLVLLNVSIVLSKLVPDREIGTPGGMKLLIKGKIYSFTAELCSGGVFFKSPVLVELKCVHGYYLVRRNGCSIAENYIIGGENYACLQTDITEVIQALIPVTNPKAPLNHTITLFDDADTLKNFRRYTLQTFKQGPYEKITSSPVGAIVTNTEQTKKIRVDKLCYEGLTEQNGASHMARLPPQSTITQMDKIRLVSNGCNSDSIIFPWGDAVTYDFSHGDTDPNDFTSEIQASLSEPFELPQSATARLEIWGGLAYCLQTKTHVTKSGNLLMKGIEPSFKVLGQHCSKDLSEENDL
ncbi:unnamed protein product [Allacma fusca]|uniref:Uncharacterized protein n=1 Tax=Allacma fusca TaxID=39272 RepID=A0A8J2JSA6_9HEXA|nr:unnamed protein product [Allacma fusca]